MSGSTANGATAVTSTIPMRIVYFRGHKRQKNSALITQVCRDFETVSALYKGECATRTLANLYNLHAVRGCTRGVRQQQRELEGDDHLAQERAIEEGADEVLVFETSMSGPHHYFGWLDPAMAHLIDFAAPGLPVFKSVPTSSMIPKRLLPVPEPHIMRLHSYKWSSGSALTSEQRQALSHREDFSQELIDTASGSADSLFDLPGILELPSDRLDFQLVENPHLYDLSPYHAQIVKADEPFQFDQAAVKSHKHAQHKLRVVTYNYGDRYLSDYIMPGSGVFIERHEFIQAITPMTKECGGFVILGRELAGVGADKCLELIAAPVPFGYALLVDVGSIHGDSTLTGTYMMAMTGNHNAMKTADTVFVKHRHVLPTTVSEITALGIEGDKSRTSASEWRNVRFHTNLNDPMDDQSDGGAAMQKGMRGDKFYLSSSAKPSDQLLAEDSLLKSAIVDSLPWLKKLWFRPVIATGGPALGWTKTHGLSLPHPKPPSR